MAVSVPFHVPDIGESEIESVLGVLKSGWLTMGKETFSFEREFAAFTGASHAIALSSCTAALHLALVAAGVGPGDEVIVPVITFVSTLEVVIYLGATPVLCDVEKDTHTIDIADLEQKITSRTKAVIPVDYSGNPCDMDALRSLADTHSFALISDAAHALPSFYKGKMVGSIADYSCFSFYATKPLTTGEGGMITTEDPEKAALIRQLRLHGINRDAWNRYAKEGSWMYDVTQNGYKYNMGDLQAALGRGQLARQMEHLEKRESIADRYNRAFSSCDGTISYSVRPESRTSWHIYPLRLNLEALSVTRDRFIEELREHDITTSVHFIPLHHFSMHNALTGDGFPHAEWIFDRVLSLPIFPSMSDEQVACVIDTVTTLLNKRRR